MMPEVPADEAMTDPTTASEEEPRGSGVDPESSPGMTSLLLAFCFSLIILLTFLFFFFFSADLSEDSDDFEPSMDIAFGDASDEHMETASTPPVVGDGII